MEGLLSQASLAAQTNPLGRLTSNRGCLELVVFACDRAYRQLVAERWGAAAPSTDKGYAVTDDAINEPVMPTQTSLNTMLHIARVQFPALSIKEVRFPNKAGG